MSQTMIMAFIEKVAEDLSRRNLQQMNNIRLSANAGRLLELKYKDKAGVVTTRFVEPYKLTDTDFWGYDPDQDGIRRFKIKNIKGVKRSSKPFEARWPIEMSEPILKAAMATAVQKRYDANELSNKSLKRVFSPVRHENPVHDRINSRAKRFEEMGDKATKNMDAAKYQRVSKTNNIRHAPAIDSKRMFRYIGEKSNSIIDTIRKRYGDDAVEIFRMSGGIANDGEVGSSISMNGSTPPKYRIGLPDNEAERILFPGGSRLVPPKEAKRQRALVVGHEVLGELPSIENLRRALLKKNLLTDENFHAMEFGTHKGPLPVHMDSKHLRLMPPPINRIETFIRENSPSGFKSGGVDISEKDLLSYLYKKDPATTSLKDLKAKNVGELRDVAKNIMLSNRAEGRHALTSAQIDEITKMLFRRI